MEEINLESLKKSFDKDSYVFIPGFLAGEDIRQLNKALVHLIKKIVPTMPSKHVFYEDKDNPATLKQMQNLFSYDLYFQQLLVESKFGKIAEALLGEKVIGKEVEYFNKSPRIGRPTPPHQDNYYFMLNPPKAVTMWMALEEVNKENGCLRYVKGSHRKSIRPHGRNETLGFSQSITDFGEKELANEVALPAQPGDLLVHHSLSIHWADANKSLTRSRRVLGLIYFAATAQEDIEAKESYKKRLEAERSG